jgi:hypothetical protein
VSGLAEKDRCLFHSWLKDYVETAEEDVLDSEIAEARMHMQVHIFPFKTCPVLNLLGTKKEITVV